MQFQLSAWRPGRYELANFAQNIQKWGAFNEENKSVPFKKIKKDLWEVETKGLEKITIVYNFYSNQLDAGSCYLDEHQLYLNPVNCMFYIVERMEEEYKIELDIPENYKIASSMKQEGNILTIKGYNLLSESPIICSDSLKIISGFSVTAPVEPSISITTFCSIVGVAHRNSPVALSSV